MAWRYLPSSEPPITHEAGTKPPRPIHVGDTIKWGDHTEQVFATAESLLHTVDSKGNRHIQFRAPIEGDHSNSITAQEAGMTILKLAKDISYTIDAANDTLDPDKGPVRLVGFQDVADVQRVNLFAREWETDRQSAVGKFPVFSSENGMFVVTVPVESVVEL